MDAQLAGRHVEYERAVNYREWTHERPSVLAHVIREWGDDLQRAGLGAVAFRGVQEVGFRDGAYWIKLVGVAYAEAEEG